MSSLADTKKIDLLNVFLVITSFLLAVSLPFKLFLFSYAILGPLHYLTEIQWLEGRSFFLKENKSWHWVLTSIAILGAVVSGFLYLSAQEGGFRSSLEFMDKNLKVLILTGFLFASGFLFLKKLLHLVAWLGVSFLASLSTSLIMPKSMVYIGVFLPTIIHVYLFTVLFILFGAKKSNSRTGFITAFLFLLLPLALTFVKVDPLEIALQEETSIQTFLESNFAGVGASIAQILGLNPDGKYVLVSETALRIQMFIAFVYTYHYLNWFSKTSIIGWKQSLTKRKIILVGSIWVAAVSLYFYDFKTGFTALFFLSLLHVLLEFPLNTITIKEVLFSPFLKKK